MDDQLHRHGIEAVGRKKLFAEAPDYSPQDLMIQLKQSDIDGFMELMYSGKTSKEGLPEALQFKFHSLQNQTAATFTDKKYPELNDALKALIAGLAHGSAR